MLTLFGVAGRRGVLAAVIVVAGCSSHSPAASTTTRSVGPTGVTTTAITIATTTTLATAKTTTLPPILVESPAPNDQVSSPLHVRGSADVFEATFRVELTDAGGRMLIDQAVMATSGTGTRGTFDTTIRFANGTAGPGRLTAFDRSPKDGSRQDLVVIPVRLSGT